MGNMPAAAESLECLDINNLNVPASQATLLPFPEKATAVPGHGQAFKVGGGHVVIRTTKTLLSDTRQKLYVEPAVTSFTRNAAEPPLGGYVYVIVSGD